MKADAENGAILSEIGLNASFFCGDREDFKRGQEGRPADSTIQRFGPGTNGRRVHCDRG
jgi:hypothetical protein